MKCSKSRRFLGLRPRPAGGAYDAPPDPLFGRASCLGQLQLRAFGASTFPDYCLYANNSNISVCPETTPSAPTALRFFFTSNMSHYLKSLKICPAWKANQRHKRDKKNKI